MPPSAAFLPRRGRKVILITGAAGFLGRHLGRELKARSPAARIVRTDIVAGPGIVPCDLIDPAAARELVRRVRPTLVFHLAGTTRPLPPAQLWKAHVSATIGLFEALRRVPGGRPCSVVVSGSSAEYGPVRGTATESTPPDPVTAYGRSKLCQSLAARSYAHLGFKVMTARIFNVSGPGIPDCLAPGTFSRQIAAIAAGPRRGRVLTGNLTARRDYVDVRDAARALVDIGKLGAGGETYNVCYGRTLSIGRLLDLLVAASGCRIDVVQDPRLIRRVDIPELAGSHAKLTRLSGWAPRIPVGESLADTLRWYLS